MNHLSLCPRIIKKGKGYYTSLRRHDVTEALLRAAYINTRQLATSFVHPCHTNSTMQPGDIELGQTNVVVPQQNGNGEVIDVNDDDDQMFENENVDKADKIKMETKSGDSNMQDDGNDDDIDDDDDENKPLGYCRFIVKHHRLAFGRCSLLLCLKSTHEIPNMAKLNRTTMHAICTCFLAVYPRHNLAN